MGKRRTAAKPDYIKWLLIAGAAALVVLLGGYAVWHYILPHSVAVDRFRYPVAGIDVSKHNGDIDFEKVLGDDYQFVFIKASEGKTYRDEAFNSNYRKAREAGLMVGAYHFFRKNRTGEEQAANFLGAIKGKKFDLPLVIDLEDDWGNGATVSRSTAICDVYSAGYSTKGEVMGIDGDVDLNVFRGSRKEWSHYLDQVKQPE